MRNAFKKYGLNLLTLVLSVALSAAAATKWTQMYISHSTLTSSAITSSTIDGTPIGVTTPSTGMFNNLYTIGLSDGCLTVTSTLVGSTPCPTLPAFTGTSGYSTIQYSGNTLYLVWGETTNFDTGPTTITFAHAFPHGCLMPPILTDNSDVSTISRIWESGNCTTTGADIRNNGSGQAHYFAIGY